MEVFNMNILNNKVFLLGALCLGFVGFIQGNYFGYYDNPRVINFSSGDKKIEVEIHREDYNNGSRYYKVNIFENLKKRTISFVVKNGFEFGSSYTGTDGLWEAIFTKNFLKGFDWNQPYADFMIEGLKAKGIKISEGLSVKVWDILTKKFVAVPMNVLKKGLTSAWNALTSKWVVVPVVEYAAFVVLSQLADC